MKLITHLRTQPVYAWAALLPVSLGLALLFTAVHLPAAVLLGCMAAGIGFSTRDIRLTVPPVGFAMGRRPGGKRPD